MTDPRPAPGWAVVAQAFPFHVWVDDDLVVRSVGRSLAKVCPGIAPGAHLADHVTLAAGPPRATLAALSVERAGPLVVTGVATGVQLRCQVVADPAPGRGLLLLATPWLGDAGELQRLGLHLHDFAPHDPTPDYVFLSQARQTALDDARRLADRMRALEASRSYQALHDPLTGAGNRRQFAERMAFADETAALVLVDVDGFKEINDTYGHPTGDAVLSAVAARLGVLATDATTIARLGGDEFAALFIGDGAADRSTQLAHGIVEAMREPIRYQGRSVRVTVSVGVVPYGDLTNLSRNADVALYSAKRDGRGSAVVFDAALHKSLLYRMELRDRLGDAVAAGAITLVYQPIVHLGTGVVHGFEALSRWTDPTLGPIPPDVFIALAEEAGLIAELGLFVLDTGARQLGEWRARFPDTDLTMSVNLAPRQLEDPDLVTQVQNVLTAYDLPPSSLQLELTESAFTSQARSTEQLHQLRALGLPLAIDDFGSSESTLARLHRVPATVLKIDRAFLLELEEAPERSTRLLQAVVAIADALDLETVAEGIETAQHHEVVRSIGVTYGQGYLYARPMDAASATQYLERELPRRHVGGTGSGTGTGTETGPATGTAIPTQRGVAASATPATPSP